MISPCNSLNVKTLTFSQLAPITSAQSNDIIHISQYDSTDDVYFSKKITFTNFAKSFKSISDGIYSGSFYMTSAITGSSLTTYGSAGSISTYIPIQINGTTYKLPLYAVS